MKKFFIILIVSVFFFVGCEGKKNEKIDYSEYLFTDINWVRDSGYDIETLKFNTDGSFSYSCACGNPVNDSDLCESYKYDEKTQEIKFECFEITEDTITIIKIIEMSDNVLKLDFNGEIREFKNNSN